MAFTVSASKLSLFRTCPQQYYYVYQARIKVPQWVMKVFGQAMHRTIELFYNPNEKLRKMRIEFEERGATQLFPRSEKGARGICYFVWGQALKQKKADPSIFHNPCLIRFDGDTEDEIKEQKNKLYSVGASMAKKYWRDNCNAPFPETPISGEKAVELRFKVPAPDRDDIFITGVIDQIRKIDGQYWVLDLKTGWWDFGEEDARVKYMVEHDYQFTVYSYAFRQLYSGKKEMGIIRYAMGYKKTDQVTGKKIDKKAILTTRNEKDYEDLAELIDFYVNCLEAGYFPKFYGYACRRCDYFEICSPPESQVTKAIEVSKIDWGAINREALIKELTPRAKKLDFCQLRLKFGKRRES